MSFAAKSAHPSRSRLLCWVGPSQGKLCTPCINRRHSEDCDSVTRTYIKNEQFSFDSSSEFVSSHRSRAMIPAVKHWLETRNVFPIIVFLGLFGMAVRNVLDPDVWWHLKTGQYIATRSAVPHVDLFSFTRGGQPWVAHEWLTELFMYGVYRRTGWRGLSVVFAAILCASFFILYLRCSKNVYLSGLIAIWGAWATTPMWGVRPQVVSLLLMSLWLLILENSERNPRLLWWTAPITLLWVNLHAGFALGLVLLALFLLGEVFEGFLQPPLAAQGARLRALTLALLLNLLLVPLNPNGLRMYAYPLNTLRSNAMQSYISEWGSPNFHRSDYWPFLVLLLVVFVRLAWTRTGTRPREIVLLLVSTLAALSSVRLIPLFALIASPLVAELGKSWAPHRNSLAVGVHRLVFNAIVLVAIAGFVGAHIATVLPQQTREEAQHFPAGAAAFLAAHPPERPIFNHYDWGGYFIWRLYPQTRVFIDGRADVYGDALFRQFMRTYLLTRDWGQILTQWNIGTVVVPPDSALAVGLRNVPGWAVRYEDQRSVILTLEIGSAAPSASPQIGRAHV